MIKRIHVGYELRVSSDADREAIGRAHDAHAARCPVARSIGGCVEITTDLRLVGDGAS